jgi:ABC-2 type transport system ATP-binding protein
MLRFERVTKRYGESRGVLDLTLEVERGELFGFIGPNGAGKTTTIRMMVGLLRPDSGIVTVEGHDVLRDPVTAKRIIGYVPDEPFVHPKLTGREMLEMSCQLWSVPRAEVKARVEEQLEVFGLQDVADSMAGGYSHGMLQKLSIASALIHDPAVLVLDEPMVGLDPRAARLVKDLLRQHCEKGNTVFFSTHVLDVAERLCTRIGIISASKLLAVGTLDDLRGSGTRDQTLEDVFLAITAPGDGATAVVQAE